MNRRLQDVGDAAVAILASNRRPAEDCAYDWRHPEQLQMLDGPSANEERRPRAARGINRSVGHWDADQVNQRQHQSDRNRREAAGTRGSVAPMITNRNIRVMTTSHTNAEGRP
jgi:hypothetical protein